MTTPGATAADAHEPAPPPPVEWRRELPAVGFMGLLFLASIGLAMGLAATFEAQGLQAFEDPEDLTNPIIYLGIVIAFTVLILLIAKYGKRVIIKYIILGSVLLTIFYVAAPLLAIVLPATGAPLGLGVAGALGLTLAIGLSALLWLYPEWYVIDVVGIVVAAGAAGIFGISFGLLPSLLLLIAFAVYDAIAVYRTKHMLDLADSVLELRLPIMFVVPKAWDYSFLEETRRVGKDAPEVPKEKREAMFMGLGDAVIPAVLVVSCLTFLDPAVGAAGLSGPLLVALATLGGSFLGFLGLMWFVLKGEAHAGLPLLNGGAIVGFLAALLPLYGPGPLVPF